MFYSELFQVCLSSFLDFDFSLIDFSVISKKGKHCWSERKLPFGNVAHVPHNGRLIREEMRTCQFSSSNSALEECAS